MNTKKTIENLFAAAGKDHNTDFFQLKETGKNTIGGPLSNYDIAKAYMKAGNYTEALIHLRLELKKTPNSPETLWRAATCNERMQNYDEAIKLYQDSIKSKMDDTTLASYVDCFVKMYDYNPENPRHRLCIMEKALIATEDRILKGEPEFEKLRDRILGMMGNTRTI